MSESTIYERVEPETRRRMLGVRRRNTGPEIRVRQVLHAMGYRFRLHRKDLPGTPDVVLPGHRKIILIHGCFWHGHVRCGRAKLPVNNADIWRAKIEGNRRRDRRNINALRKLGWKVLVLWECRVRDIVRLEERLHDFLAHR